MAAVLKALFCGQTKKLAVLGSGLQSNQTTKRLESKATKRLEHHTQMTGAMLTQFACYLLQSSAWYCQHLITHCMFLKLNMIFYASAHYQPQRSTFFLIGMDRRIVSILGYNETRDVIYGVARTRIDYLRCNITKGISIHLIPKWPPF